MRRPSRHASAAVSTPSHRPKYEFQPASRSIFIITVGARTETLAPLSMTRLIFFMHDSYAAALQTRTRGFSPRWASPRSVHNARQNYFTQSMTVTILIASGRLLDGFSLQPLCFS